MYLLEKKNRFYGPSMYLYTHRKCLKKLFYQSGYLLEFYFDFSLCGIFTDILVEPQNRAYIVMTYDNVKLE